MRIDATSLGCLVVNVDMPIEDKEIVISSHISCFPKLLVKYSVWCVQDKCRNIFHRCRGAHYCPKDSLISHLITAINSDSIWIRPEESLEPRGRT